MSTKKDSDKGSGAIVASIVYMSSLLKCGNEAEAAKIKYNVPELFVEKTGMMEYHLRKSWHINSDAAFVELTGVFWR